MTTFINTTQPRGRLAVGSEPAESLPAQQRPLPGSRWTAGPESWELNHPSIKIKDIRSRFLCASTHAGRFKSRTLTFFLPLKGQQSVWNLRLWCYCNSHQDLLKEKNFGNRKCRRPRGSARSPVTRLLRFRHLETTRASLSSSRWTRILPLLPDRFKVTFLPNLNATKATLTVVRSRAANIQTIYINWCKENTFHIIDKVRSI